MTEHYRLMKVKQDAWVHVCERCGVMIYSQQIHNKWHDTNDRFESSFFDILLQVLGRMAEEGVAHKTDTIMETPEGGE